MKSPFTEKGIVILRALSDSEMPWLTDRELAELTGFDDETVRLEVARFQTHTMPLTATIFQKGARPRYHLHDYGRAMIRGLDGTGESEFDE